MTSRTWLVRAALFLAGSVFAVLSSPTIANAATTCIGVCKAQVDDASKPTGEGTNKTDMFQTVDGRLLWLVGHKHAGKDLRVDIINVHLKSGGPNTCPGEFWVNGDQYPPTLIGSDLVCASVELRKNTHTTLEYDNSTGNAKDIFKFTVRLYEKKSGDYKLIQDIDPDLQIDPVGVRLPWEYLVALLIGILGTLGTVRIIRSSRR